MDFFSNQPPALKVAMALFTGGILAAVAVIDYRLIAILAICAVVLAALLASYHYIVQWRESKKSSALRGQIQQHSAAAPNSINDPAKRARLDDLKRNFDSGLDKFKTSGKDVYKLPWYLIVGEPGSGKTEAVRHCNVGFPPGLQDELQGVGGTINMNWWFTNQAVLLDTAGRLMFEEVKPGESSEWREFLQLLKRNRPTCPVNGLLLVIPAESLIRDSADAIHKKAGKIAQQLDLIQRSLDIRFPVFVLITKCDLLNGFREFFEDFQDSQTQHQMLGWSNPEPRDAVFNPSLVDQHLDTVTQRIRKRRLGLLRDPVPQANGGKRIDEVDSLFALPQSFALIAPRLRTYLETVFVAGEWSAKPLFLRGIYFTSAMREGQALDQELAQALGLAVDDLPEGHAWERERAYFLRDLFTEKVFREKGLVTRATNTKVLLRRRQAFFLGFLALACLTWLGLTYYGIRGLSESVGQQSKYWMPAARDWDRGVWQPVTRAALSKDAAVNMVYDYKGDSKVEDLPLAQYHERIRQLSSEAIHIPWVFRPLARLSLSLSDRQKAQRILFEGSVVKPLTEAARRRMQDRPALPTEIGGAGMSNLMLREAIGVAALIKMEAAAIAHDSKNTAALPQDFLSPILQYDTDSDYWSDQKNLAPLAEVLTWTYSTNKFGNWPAPWSLNGSSLETNKPVRAGVERLIGYAQESSKTQESGVVALRKLRDDLSAFRKKETELNTVAVAPDDPQQVTGSTERLFGELRTIKQSLDDHLKEARQLNANPSDWFLLSQSYAKLIGDSQTQSKEAFELIQKSVNDYASHPENPANATHPLFIQVSEKLKQEQAALKQKIESGFNKKEIDELQMLDQTLLADSGDGRPLYVVRWSMYDSSHGQLAVQDKFGELIGQDWLAVMDIKDRIAKTRQTLTPFKEKLKDPFAASDYFLARAEETRVDGMMATYVRQTHDRFERDIHYPLVSKDGKALNTQQLEQADALLMLWKKDLSSENFKKIQSPRRARLEKFLTTVDEMHARKQSLSGNVTITLMSYTESPEKEGLNRFRKILVGGREVDTSSASSTRLDTCPVLGVFRAQFLDYSVSPQQSYSYSTEAIDLLAQARQSNGRARVKVGGLSVWLEVASDGAPVDLRNPPSKPAILGLLSS